MGIRDRDYMKRRQDDDDEGRSSCSSGLAARLVTWFSAFFEKYPRFGVWLAAVLGALLLVVLVVARLAQR